jgi:ribosomal protein S18 acetylase RimI-like enzyme
MTKDLLFSAAGPADVQALANLVNSAHRGETSRKGWTTDADFLEGIRSDVNQISQMINEKDATIIKCNASNGTLLGCVYLQMQGVQLYLGMLSVSPDIQARGIGKQLMNYSEQYALCKGCSRIVMTVITLRHELIAWYERRGYVKTPEVKPFPDDPNLGIPKQKLEFVVMEKILQ